MIAFALDKDNVFRLTQSQCLVEKPEKAVTYEESSLVDTANGQPNEDKAREALGYKEEGNAGFLLSVFNLMNAILGLASKKTSV